MTFGIPPDAICVTLDGELKRKNHLEWIKMRKHQELNDNSYNSSSSSARIMIPSRGDVLFGRGKPFREHIGNLRLFNLLDENLDIYESRSLKEKSAVIAEMVTSIHSEGGRFLIKQDGLCWMEVDDKQAREKVSHAFRTRLRIHSSAHESDTNTGSPGSSPMIRPEDHPSYNRNGGEPYMGHQQLDAKRARVSD
jgi:hypothetical protein